ncbi:hypothetical protein NEMBOFW57_001141 [Staphylotrichum longicolle]|uniref:Serine hydrolase domain-containing protein n=1 Tax=Staphylotrichum longicolle TaxID=669026 RepID=A0AAD4F189_9PEZI|nr:hypothetical protein NEMBOFW57_001141 [Staphylotrichum longicolle]
MKPKIIFLHGSGTNVDIFRIQTRHLSSLLAPHFQLIYLAAPHPCPPGPGVLPFFEGCGPYLTWMDDRSPEKEHAYWGSGGGGGDANEGAGVKKALGGDEDGDGVGQGVVGVVGFSMGAKVGMEVVRRLEKEYEGGGAIRVKIMVAICGTVPFGGGGGDEDGAREKGWKESLGKGLVSAESVHLIGERDPWRGESEKLVQFFGEEGRRVLRFKGGHHMPVEDAVNRQVVRMILAACQES